MSDLFSFAAPPPPPTASADDRLLDPEQAAAATAPERRIVVRAGAGTGKTRTLVARIVHLVETRGMAPENVVAVTFTNKAAGEIRERLAARLGVAVARRVVLGTFHAISARILRRNAARAGLDRRFSIVDDSDVKRLVRDAVVACGALPRAEGVDDDKYAAAVSGYADTVAARIRLWKAWGLTPTRVEDEARPRRSVEEETAARVYVSYQDDLRRRNLADFSDLVLKTVEMLDACPDVLAYESGLVRHLLVDEAQDANPVQVRWAQTMSGVHGEATSIGDEDQSIFSFQAGYPAAILDIAGPGAAVYALTANRRCTAEILEPAVRLVGWNRRSTPKVLASDRHGPKPVLTLCGNEKEEASALAAALKGRLDAGAPAESLAVLVRSAWAMKPVEEALLKACLPYQLVGGLAFADYEEVKDVAAFLKLAINPRDDLAFGRIVNKPARGLGPAAEFAIIARNPSSALPFHEVCQSVRSRADMVHDAQWREGLAKLSGVLMALDSAAADPRCTSAELVEIVLHDNGAGYEAFVSKGRDKKAARRKMDNLRALQRLAEEEPSPVEMVDRVLLSTDKLAALEPGKIRLSTIHSSKGLEWEHVYLPAFASDVIPAPRAAAAPCLGTPGDPWEGPVGGGVEEERRLAHVALTRAKQSVTISSYLSRAGRKCHPSVFLPESGLEDILSIDAYEDGLSRAKGSMKSVRAGRSGFKRGKGF